MTGAHTTRNRRARGRLPRCNACRFPIVWFSWRGSWRRYEPGQVDGRTHQGPPAHPVEGRRAWPLRELVEDLMVRRQISSAEAEDEVYAMPWHVPHVCPPDRDTTTNTKERPE